MHPVIVVPWGSPTFGLGSYLRKEHICTSCLEKEWRSWTVSAGAIGYLKAENMVSIFLMPSSSAIKVAMVQNHLKTGAWIPQRSDWTTSSWQRDHPVLPCRRCSFLFCICRKTEGYYLGLAMAKRQQMTAYRETSNRVLHLGCGYPGTPGVKLCLWYSWKVHK